MVWWDWGGAATTYLKYDFVCLFKPYKKLCEWKTNDWMHCSALMQTPKHQRHWLDLHNLAAGRF